MTVDLNSVLIVVGFVGTMLTLSYKLGGTLSRMTEMLDDHDRRILELEEHRERIHGDRLAQSF